MAPVQTHLQDWEYDTEEISCAVGEGRGGFLREEEWPMILVGLLSLPANIFFWGFSAKVSVSMNGYGYAS